MLLGDRGEVSESLCYHLDVRYGIMMIAIRRTNIQPNTLAKQQLLRMYCKRIETCNSQLERWVLRASMRDSLPVSSRLRQRSVR